jgi:hypothetical protein
MQKSPLRFTREIQVRLMTSTAKAHDVVAPGLAQSVHDIVRSFGKVAFNRLGERPHFPGTSQIKRTQANKTHRWMRQLIMSATYDGHLMASAREITREIGQIGFDASTGGMFDMNKGDTHGRSTIGRSPAWQCETLSPRSSH